MRTRNPARRGARAMAGAMLLLATACAGTGDGGRAPASIAMAGEGVFPESLDADSAGTLYIGSNPGTIYRAPAGGARAEPWIVPDARNGLQSVFGVRVDEARGRLLVCSNPNAMADPPQQGAAAIKAFRLADGAYLSSHRFPAGGGAALCNDIAIAPDGTLYASDTIGGRVARLAPGAEELTDWAVAPELAGVDGIAFGPGGALFANSIRQHTLLRLAIAPDGAFAGADVLATSRALEGPDGLRPLGANRMLQTEGPGGRVTVLTFAPTGAVKVQTIAEGIDYPSSAVAVGARAYYPEGRIAYLFDPALRGRDPGLFTVRSAPLPEVP